MTKHHLFILDFHKGNSRIITRWFPEKKKEKKNIHLHRSWNLKRDRWNSSSVFYGSICWHLPLGWAIIRGSGRSSSSAEDWLDVSFHHLGPTGGGLENPRPHIYRKGIITRFLGKLLVKQQFFPNFLQIKQPLLSCFPAGLSPCCGSNLKLPY